jgi:hypothetical protein
MAQARAVHEALRSKDMRTRRILLFATLLPALTFAQTVPPAAELVSVPALTPLVVRLEEEVSTKRQKPGDHFKLAVAEDVRIGDVVVIPAGSPGEGEVIHVGKPGAGGKAGELILAARFVRVGETEVRLRSFVLGVTGKNHADAALATSLVIGPLAMFVRGGSVIVPSGALGSAKTTFDLQLPAVKSDEAPPADPLPSSSSDNLSNNARSEENESKPD